MEKTPEKTADAVNLGDRIATAVVATKKRWDKG